MLPDACIRNWWLKSHAKIKENLNISYTQAGYWKHLKQPDVVHNLQH